MLLIARAAEEFSWIQRPCRAQWFKSCEFNQAAACSEDDANDNNQDQIRPSQQHIEPELGAGGSRFESQPLPGEAQGALTEQKQYRKRGQGSQPLIELAVATHW